LEFKKYMDQNYFEILGVSSSSTEKEIKQAYYKLARELHPDKARTPDEREENEQIFAEVSKAYNVLKNKRRREDYSQTLKAKDGKSSKKPEKTIKKKSDKKRSLVTANRSGGSSSAGREKEKVIIAKKAYVKGVQLFKIGEYKKSVTFFKAAIENDSTEAVYYYRLAMSMMKSRMSFSQGVEYINKAIDMDPYNMDYKILLGEIYEMAGGLSMAEKIYTEIMKWDPTHQKAKNHLEMLGVSTGKQKSKSFFVNLFRKLQGK